MKKLIFCSLCLLGSLGLNAQDGVFWGYTVKLEFETFQFKKSTDSIVSIKFYENTSSEPYLPSRGNCYSGVKTSGTNSFNYIISKSCSAIGGPNSFLKIKPPNLYLYFTITSKGFKKQPYTYVKVIPIYFSATEKNGAIWNLSQINLKDYLHIDALPKAIKVNNLENFEFISPSLLDVEVFSLIELNSNDEL
ncbi:hypothetical protein [Aurantibacter aestuarii]|uniref:Uncharacterized protein n=1 Tax=Aurantibacter aestuarii TaxID=1266046 RepID=A0A2T1NCY5_9FLAO|nr:hypothetical protein [Aurantibacter aestuarii]PSG90310.1 hypothetical protein C7H52_03250 [Aurantibacter aestuarii]